MSEKLDKFKAFFLISLSKNTTNVEELQTAVMKMEDMCDLEESDNVATGYKVSASALNQNELFSSNARNESTDKHKSTSKTSKKKW